MSTYTLCLAHRNPPLHFNERWRRTGPPSAKALATTDKTFIQK